MKRQALTYILLSLLCGVGSWHRIGDLPTKNGPIKTIPSNMRPTC